MRRLPAKLRDTVIVSWDRKVPAKIIRRGPEVSEVQFADGRVRFIPNDQLTEDDD